MPNQDLGPTIYDFKVGQTESIVREITQEKITAFADAIDDHDPIHTDPEYAKTTIYGRCITHGVYLDCAISAMLSELVRGGIDAKMTVKYTAPVFAGDTITVTGTVREVNVERNRIYIDTLCTNQDGVVVEKGDATCLARVAQED